MCTVDGLLELLSPGSGYTRPEDIGPRVDKERDTFLACHLADGMDAGAARVPDVREDEDAARVMERA
jgi:hypothetical protein